MAEYIEREAAKKMYCDICTEKSVCYRGKESCPERRAFDRIPAADVRPVVRCGECEYSAIGYENRRYCKLVTYYNHVPDDWFCADGKRKDGDGDV